MERLGRITALCGICSFGFSFLVPPSTISCWLNGHGNHPLVCLWFLISISKFLFDGLFFDRETKFGPQHMNLLANKKNPNIWSCRHQNKPTLKEFTVLSRYSTRPYDNIVTEDSIVIKCRLTFAELTIRPPIKLEKRGSAPWQVVT